MELLSPAGSFEALKAAVSNGADAVYFGGNALNARINAANFDNDALIRAIDYCHVRGVKAYITLNTLVLDREMRAGLEFARFLHTNGADAVIVQDLGLVHLLQEHIPQLEIHASTQMGISSSAGLRLCEDLGIKRAVLSREVSLKSIERMRRHSFVELEAFVHGAMCVSFSGGCLFSSMAGGRSGNRGVCAQPCRKPLALAVDGSMQIDKNRDYALSLGDMCMLFFIDDMRRAGVSCIKIEGRMKKPEYVAAATYAYRRAIDGAKPLELHELMSELYEMFNRGDFTTGYYYGDGCAANRRASAAADKKLIAKRRENERNLIDRLEKTVAMRLNMQVGERAKLDVWTVNPILNKRINICVYGQICQKANKTVDAALRKRLVEQLSKLGGTPFRLDASQSEVLCEYAFLPLSAINDLRRHAIEKLERTIAEAFKRVCAQADALLGKKPTDALTFPLNDGKDSNELSAIYARVVNYKQGAAVYETAKSCDVSLVLSGMAFDDAIDCIRRLDKKRRAHAGIGTDTDTNINIKINTRAGGLYVALPVFMDESQGELWESFFDAIHTYIDGVEINNWGQVKYTCDERFKRVLGGAGLNVLNTASYAAALKLKLSGITLSPELREVQALDLIKNVRESYGVGAKKTAIGCYGRELLMTLRHCPLREKLGEYACKRIGATASACMLDGEGRRFPIMNFGVGGCGECILMLLNCVPLDIRKNLLEAMRVSGNDVRMSMSFYDEGEEDVRRIIGELCSRGSESAHEIATLANSTRGRWNA